MDKNTIIRIFSLLFSLLNLILTECGINPIPIADDVVYQIISIAVTVVLAVWNAWKNNNITPAAKAGQMVIDAIKNDTITAEKIEKLLNENKAEQ